MNGQSSGAGWRERIAFGLLVLAGSGLFARLGTANVPERELAGYATSLRGRTTSQKHNARKAAQALDGQLIAPGATFSFNAIVRSWSWDQGYVKAPVSYDGELIRAYGGGVCQTSTTLYNAALLAGLPIVERHPHVFAPHYVPPGRDAAVAQRTVDLRFRNPFAWPIRIAANGGGDRLKIRLLGAGTPPESVAIVEKVLSAQFPERRTRIFRGATVGDTGQRFVRNPGATGYRVMTYRVFSQKGRTVRRERLGDDSYEAMNRMVQYAEDESPRL